MGENEYIPTAEELKVLCEENPEILRTWRKFHDSTAMDEGKENEEGIEYSEKLCGVISKIKSEYDSESQLKGEFIKINNIHDDDSIEIIVKENDVELRCRIKSVSQYKTPEGLYNYWRTSKNNVNEDIDYDIPKNGTTSEKLLQLFEENDNVLYVKSKNSELKNSEISRFVLADLQSEKMKNLDKAFKDELVKENKKYNVFCTFINRDDINDWIGLSPWNWQESNPYANSPEVHYYATTKSEAINKYLESDSWTAKMLRGLVEDDYSKE